MFLGPLAIVVAIMPALRAVDVLLPDLVSDWGEYDEYTSGIDDARIRPVEEITYKGVDMLVVRFDGFVTNVGDGPLRVAGNPQTDSVYQWLLEAGGDPLNPADYQAGPKVSVIYETDDGHNHWHLRNAQEYALWNEDRTEQVTVGAKVGFCLYDIGQIWATAPPRYYDGSVVQFCDQGDPSSTTIEMGVTPGWKDVYGYTLNQQWVDVSAVAPGVYFLSNQTDTSNQIVESDETNNGLSFHPDPVMIPGHLPGDTTATTTKGITVDVDLPSTSFGSPGSIGFEIVTEPHWGTVTVDATGTATYTPDAGFSGPDSFTFAVFDTTSSYPKVRPTATVGITVTNTPPQVTDPGAQTWTEGDPVNLAIDATDADGDSLSFTTTGLPDGLSAATDADTITGTPTTASDGTATIRVTDGDDTTEVTFTWTVDVATTPPPSGGGGGGGGGSVPPPAPAPAPVPVPAPTPGFEDVPDSHPFFVEITWLAAQGITNGCGPTTFCPDASMTRAQLASFLVRTFKLTPSDSDWFDDDNGSVHEDDINALAAAGITTGCGARSYCPDTAVTRAEWASFLVRAMYPLDRASESDPFGDDDGSVHEMAIGVLWDEGLTTGCGAGMYCPNDHITRGQLAAFLYREFGDS